MTPNPTRYHDFHLREYRDFGKRITLDLVFDYAGKPKDESLKCNES